MSLKSNYEYIRDWCNHRFLRRDEKVDVDLSNYYTKDEVYAKDETGILWVKDPGNWIESTSKSNLCTALNITSEQFDKLLAGKYPIIVTTFIDYGEVTCTGRVWSIQEATPNDGVYYIEVDSHDPTATRSIWIGINSNNTYSFGWSGSRYESREFKVTSISSSNNDVQYPSAKAVYDFVTNNTSNVGTLNTNNTTAQTASSSESLSGTINLHKVAKTGTYSDLIGTPTIPSAPGTLNTNNALSQSVSSSEALSGTIKLHKVAKTGTYLDLINAPRIFVGTSATAAGTAAKAVVCSSYNALNTGDVVFVRFTNTNTVASPTLNVNSKGAKTIKCLVNGQLVDLPNAGMILANQTLQFQYDGTYWVLMNTDTLPDLSPYLTIADYQTDEEVIAASLNELNTRIKAVEDDIETVLDQIIQPTS